MGKCAVINKLGARGSATGGTCLPIFESAGDNPPIFRKIVGQIRRVFGFWYGLPSEENSGFAAAWSPSAHFHRRGGAPAGQVKQNFHFH